MKNHFVKKNKRNTKVFYILNDYEHLKQSIQERSK